MCDILNSSVYKSLCPHFIMIISDYYYLKQGVDSLIWKSLKILICSLFLSSKSFSILWYRNSSSHYIPLYPWYLTPLNVYSSTSKIIFNSIAHSRASKNQFMSNRSNKALEIGFRYHSNKSSPKHDEIFFFEWSTLISQFPHISISWK